MILLRHGANPSPHDGGISPVLALLDKLVEFNETGSYPYQLVSCLKILLLALPFIELPYKVKWNFSSVNSRFNSFYILVAVIVRSEKANVSRKVLSIICPEIDSSKQRFRRRRLETFKQVCFLRTKTKTHSKTLNLNDFPLRCAVREALRQNFQLPNGINSLKIPRALKRYVDLLQE